MEQNISGEKVMFRIYGKDPAKDNLPGTMNAQVHLKAFVNTSILAGKYSHLTCLYISNI